MRGAFISRVSRRFLASSMGRPHRHFTSYIVGPAVLTYTTVAVFKWVRATVGYNKAARVVTAAKVKVDELDAFHVQSTRAMRKAAKNTADHPLHSGFRIEFYLTEHRNVNAKTALDEATLNLDQANNILDQYARYLNGYRWLSWTFVPFTETPLRHDVMEMLFALKIRMRPNH